MGLIQRAVRSLPHPSLAATSAQPAPFDALAESYDAAFTYSFVGRAQRRVVWVAADKLFRAGQRILEINCGTGADALHLARRGVRVVACDSSASMVAVARRLMEWAGVQSSVDLRVLATQDIAQLQAEGPFDGVFSNFGGLNCVEDLAPVACDLARLAKPGAKALLCLFGPHCLWEVLWYLARADLRTAFRRFRRGGTVAKLGGGVALRVYYPSVRRLKRLFSPHFRLERWQGVGVAVPPSYLEFLTSRLPRTFRAAAALDSWLGRAPVLRGLADHILLTFERSRT
jgi:ubiquinone/menaquinone biosynthesis C-methylase UbiE